MSLFLHFVMTSNLRQANAERKPPAHFKHKCMNLQHFDNLFFLFIYFFIKSADLHYVLLKVLMTPQHLFQLACTEHLNNSRSLKFPERPHPKQNEQTNKKKETNEKKTNRKHQVFQMPQAEMLIPNQRVPSCSLGQYK